MYTYSRVYIHEYICIFINVCTHIFFFFSNQTLVNVVAYTIIYTSHTCGGGRYTERRRVHDGICGHNIYML